MSTVIPHSTRRETEQDELTRRKIENDGDVRTRKELRHLERDESGHGSDWKGAQTLSVHFEENSRRSPDRFRFLGQFFLVQTTVMPSSLEQGATPRARQAG